MINILIRIIAEGTKAAAPHVAKGAHHVVRHATEHVAPLLIPKLATGGASAGAIGAARLGQVKAKGAQAATSHVPAKPHISASPAAGVEPFAKGAGEIVAGEAASYGGVAAIRKVRKARHKGPGEAAEPTAA